ncbi:MAG: AMP-binding protein [Candidatus Omnitrophota bacterium]
MKIILWSGVGALFVMVAGVIVFVVRGRRRLLHVFNWILTHTVYKIRVVGAENVPRQGGALLVCNHVSYADPPLVLASLKRHVRFLVYRPIYENRFLNPLCRLMGAIPISLTDPPKTIMRSLQEARQAIEEGHLVCIFAEGALTRTGNMLNFNRGVEYIMKGLDAPIIPMHLDCIWGSIFSYERGKYFWKMPRVTPYPITVSFGKALSASTKVHEIRLAVQELSSDAFKLRGKYQEKLHMAFVREAKKRPFKLCVADSAGMKLNYIQALGSSILLSKKLFVGREISKEPEKVGVLLPPSSMAALINGAILLAGKIVVNLNYTSSQESLYSAIRQCKMKKIITSRKFLERLKMESMDSMVFLEDLKSQIHPIEKIAVVLAVFLLPAFLIKLLFVRGDRTNVEDIATIIFSSGSTGEPKGVMLSHANVFSNIQGFWQVANIKANDVIMGILPFFHSFGFSACLCFPLGTGLTAVYHSNPLDGATIGKLVEKYKASIILGTPTFFSSYIRKCKKEQFRTLRYAIAGAEKLQSQFVTAFYEKFGIVPFEGYGATELSPIISLSVPDPDNRKEDIIQVGNKLGKVGHPIPGVAAKVVDPETFSLLSFDEEGLLLIKGPNVMKGYLGNPEKTKEVFEGDWYITGDIATIDKDGFIHITDRLSRFSKIAGEMVPHIKIEEEVLNILGVQEQACVVTAVSDEKKGEALVIFYKGTVLPDQLWECLNQRDIPKLWIPKKENLCQVADIPLLGSGKRDLKKIKEMAQQMVCRRQKND